MVDHDIMKSRTTSTIENELLLELTIERQINERTLSSRKQTTIKENNNSIRIETATWEYKLVEPLVTWWQLSDLLEPNVIKIGIHSFCHQPFFLSHLYFFYYVKWTNCYFPNELLHIWYDKYQWRWIHYYIDHTKLFMIPSSNRSNFHRSQTLQNYFTQTSSVECLIASSIST